MWERYKWMHSHTCGDRFLSNVRLLSGNSANLGVNRMRQAVEAKLQIGSQVSQLLAEQCTDHGHLLPRGHSHGAKFLRRRRHQLVVAVVVLVMVFLCCPCRAHCRRRINKYTSQCSIFHQHQDLSLIESINFSDVALYKQSANQPTCLHFFSQPLYGSPLYAEFQWIGWRCSKTTKHRKTSKRDAHVNNIHCSNNSQWCPKRLELNKSVQSLRVVVIGITTKASTNTPTLHSAMSKLKLKSKSKSERERERVARGSKFVCGTMKAHLRVFQARTQLMIYDGEGNYLGTDTRIWTEMWDQRWLPSKFRTNFTPYYTTKAARAVAPRLSMHWRDYFVKCGRGERDTV